MGKGSLDEASDFEEKMAQLRMLQMQKKQGTAPDQKVINKKQTLTQKLNMLKKAYFDLISAMEKETDLEFAVSGDWYQEQLDDLENSIGDLETKMLEIKTTAVGESELGPLKYLSQLTGVAMDRIINWYILVIKNIEQFIILLRIIN